MIVSARSSRLDGSVNAGDPGESGLTALLPCLTVAATEAAFDVEGDGVRLSTREGDVDFAALGEFREGESQVLRAALRRGADPGTDLPEFPWSAVCRREDGSVVAASSTMQGAGIFYRAEGTRRLLVGTDPARLGRVSACRVAIDEEAIVRSAAGDLPRDRTPFAGVRRVPAGNSLIWRPGASPRLVQWCGPEVWPRPDLGLREAVEALGEALEPTILDNAARAGGPFVTLSGGLDSSYVAGVLARQGSEAVRAYVSVPHPSADLPVGGARCADDAEYARAVTAWHGGRVALHEVVNTGGLRPLDAAQVALRRTSLPAFGVLNAPWIELVGQRAGADGARMILVGGQGNFSFSYGTPATARGVVAWLHRWRHGLRRAPNLPRTFLTMHTVGAGRVGTSPPSHRSLLARADAGAVEGLSLCGPTPAADPFAARTVLDVAARVRDDVWTGDRMGRPVARAMLDDLAPERIRLRDCRGGQGWDAWYTIRDDRARYAHEVDLLGDTPILREIVDLTAVAAEVARWPWHRNEFPKQAGLAAVHRLISLGTYVRWLISGLG